MRVSQRLRSKLDTTAARAFLLAAVVLAAFSSSLPNRWVWDDGAYVTHNGPLLEEGGLRRIWLDTGATPQYYPLVHTSFWLEVRLWGTETLANGHVSPLPFGFHFDNVLLHAGSIVLLYLLLLRLRVPAPWFAAAVVGLHPIAVESVAWVTERKNVLSAFFALASALAFLSYVHRTRRLMLATSLLLFLFALLSKTVVASLPAVLFLLLWWRREPLSKRTLVPLGAMLVIGATLGLHTAALERDHVGATGLAWDWTPVERCLIAGRALWTYLGKLLTPWDLAFMYPRWQVDSSDPIQYAYPLSAVLLVVAAFILRRRIGRGPLVALLIFGGVLFPALGFLNVYPHRFSFVADHFQHHAAMAILVLMASSASRAPWIRDAFDADASRSSLGPRRWLVVSAAALLVGVLGVLSWSRCHAFKDARTLWEDTIRRTPSASIAYNNLASIELAEYDDFGRPRRPRLLTAARLFQKAVDTDPTNQHALNNLGLASLQLNRPKHAEEVFLLAIERRPDYFQSYANLGSLYAGLGRLDEAIVYMEKANELCPTGRIAAACASLGAMYFEQGELELAEERLAFAIEERFPHPNLHLDYAKTLHHLGKAQEAIWMYEVAAQEETRSAQSAIGLVWILSSHKDPGIRNDDRALSLANQLLQQDDQQLSSILDAGASAYANVGRYDEAMVFAQRAIALVEAADTRREEIRARLTQYAAQRPYRSSAGLPCRQTRGECPRLAATVETAPHPPLPPED